MNKQRGAAFILFFVLMVVGFGIFFLQTSNTDDRKNEAQTRKALLEAKEALIGFAVSTVHTDNGGTIRMGRLPWPDRNNDSYDGRGDQDTSTGMPGNRFMLGNFPRRDDEFDGTNIVDIGVDVRDGSGERLWYAVSPNLVRYGGTGSTIQPVVDPSLNLITTNWLTIYVHDINGAQIQQIDNVAFVLLAPGSAINGQVRNGIAPPANSYLDVSGIRSNSDAINGVPLDFVMAPKRLNLAPAFNDELVYVTRDELLMKVEERAFKEWVDLLRPWLNTYFTTNNFYPYAADTSNACVINQTTGLIATSIGTCTSFINYTAPSGTSAYLLGWPADITYQVRTDCVETPAPTVDCNLATTPGGLQINGQGNYAVVLSSTLFPQLTAHIP